MSQSLISHTAVGSISKERLRTARERSLGDYRKIELWDENRRGYWFRLFALAYRSRSSIVSDICSQRYGKIDVARVWWRSAVQRRDRAHDTHVARQYVDHAANKIHSGKPLDSRTPHYREKEDGRESRSDLQQLLVRQVQYVLYK